MSGTTEYDVVVVGGGAAGAVCAASLQLRGVRTLLVAETAQLGHNVRSPELDGHKAFIQHPWWHVAWGGGAWARVVREQDLPARVHLSSTSTFGVRGRDETVVLPTVISARSIADALFALVPVQDEGVRRGVQRALYEGLLLDHEQLFAMHDVPYARWLQDIGADPATTQVMLGLGAMFTSLQADAVARHLSVFGAFASLRSFLGGESWTCIIEPDTQTGLVQPLGERVSALGGEVWTGTPVERVLVEEGAVQGVRLRDGREARAGRVAMAVGNPRLPALLDPLPTELKAPLNKEAPLALEEVFVLTLLDCPAAGLESFQIVVDPTTGGLLWIVPNTVLAPWLSPDDRHLVAVWVKDLPGGAPLTDAAVDAYVDEVLEERFPGWTASIDRRTHLRHRHHWLNPAYLGPKVPRRSSSVRGLWYVGEGTEPVAGLGLEQASHAGYQGALDLVDDLGLTREPDPARAVGAFPTARPTS